MFVCLYCQCANILLKCIMSYVLSVGVLSYTLETLLVREYSHFACRGQEDGRSGNEGPHELGEQCRGPQVLVITKRPETC